MERYVLHPEQSAQCRKRNAQQHAANCRQHGGKDGIAKAVRFSADRPQRCCTRPMQHAEEEKTDSGFPCPPVCDEHTVQRRRACRFGQHRAVLIDHVRNRQHDLIRGRAEKKRKQHRAVQSKQRAERR